MRPNKGLGLSGGIALVLSFTTMFAFSSLCSAAMIRVDYSGTLTNVDAALTPFFMNGDAFSGSYVFDSNAPDTDMVINSGTYAASNYSVAFTRNGYSATANAGTIQTSLPGFGAYTYNSRATPPIVGNPVNGNSPDFYVLELGDSTRQVFQTPALPSTLNLGDFDIQSFTFGFIGQDELNLIGSVTSLSFTPVPVPSAILLMGTGLCGLVGLRWWSRKNI